LTISLSYTKKVEELGLNPVGYQYHQCSIRRDVIHSQNIEKVYHRFIFANNIHVDKI